jgi:hypothetical protein
MALEFERLFVQRPDLEEEFAKILWAALYREHKACEARLKMRLTSAEFDCLGHRFGVCLSADERMYLGYTIRTSAHLTRAECECPLMGIIEDIHGEYEHHHAWKINGLTQSQFLAQSIELVRAWATVHAKGGVAAAAADANCERIANQWERAFFPQED